MYPLSLKQKNCALALIFFISQSLMHKDCSSSMLAGRWNFCRSNNANPRVSNPTKRCMSHVISRAGHESFSLPNQRALISGARKKRVFDDRTPNDALSLRGARDIFFFCCTNDRISDYRSGTRRTRSHHHGYTPRSRSRALLSKIWKLSLILSTVFFKRNWTIARQSQSNNINGFNIVPYIFFSPNVIVSVTIISSRFGKKCIEWTLMTEKRHSDRNEICTIPSQKSCNYNGALAENRSSIVSICRRIGRSCNFR